MRLLLVVAGSFALLMTSACSPIGPECAKASECKELGDQTEDQCSADYEKQQADMEADAACQIVVDKYLALFDCQAGLSCEQRKDVGNSVCASLNSDLVGAIVTNPGCLFK